MTEVLTSAQMRALEQAAIASGAVTGLALMERAGLAVVGALTAPWEDATPPDDGAIVLCGPGNNGGDGYVIARLLAGRGWTVQVWAYGDGARLSGDARANRDLWVETGDILPWDADALCAALDGHGGPVIDALFGTGLTRPLPAEVTRVLQAARPGHRVAVDIPSGLHSDSGADLGAGTADLTVTFHAPKLGHFLGAGGARCGSLAVADIGLGDATVAAVAPDLPPQQRAAVTLVAAPPAARVLKQAVDTHKYGYGHALVQAGPMGRSGAGRLAARGALRIGAGLVTVAAPGNALMECANQLTAIMLRRCNGPEDMAALLQDARFSAVCLGPGMGVGAATRDLVLAGLAAGRPTVLDADALTSFHEAPGDLFAALGPQVVLTPHIGEFARLFPDLAAGGADDTEASKVTRARAAAARAGCIMLLKGPDTVIASPDGACALHAALGTRAAPGLATAGAGDVLAGFITGLMARGLPAMEAAGAATWLHAEAARCFGPGLIAEDLPETLPRVLSALRDG